MDAAIRQAFAHHACKFARLRALRGENTPNLPEFYGKQQFRLFFNIYFDISRNII